MDEQIEYVFDEPEQPQSINATPDVVQIDPGVADMNIPPVQKPRVAVVGNGFGKIAAMLAASAAASGLVEPAVLGAGLDGDVPPVPSVPSIDELSYEVDLGNGATETYDTSGPNANRPTLDPITQAKVKKFAKRYAKKLLHKAKRDAMLAEGRASRTTKRRKKRKLEKASRKRNR